MAATAGTLQQLQLTLMVDKANFRVVYAECDRFMADALFSFLTTPVAALVRRSGKSSGLPCMDSLYQSVEDMPADLFHTPECQKMLLRPRSAFGFAHHRLKLAVNDVDEVYYVCPTLNCPLLSLFPGRECCCGRGLTETKQMKIPPPLGGDEVFIRKGAAAAFVVTDDLFIAPSTDAIKDLLRIHAGVAAPENLEQRIVFVDNDQIVKLMKLSLRSYTPLSDTFLTTDFPAKPIHWPLTLLEQRRSVKTENSYGCMKKLEKCFGKMITFMLGPKKMAITLFHDQDRVLYARVDKSFADLLLSFLTLPFGSVVAAYDGKSSLRCMDSLHQAVKKFQSDHLFCERSIIPNQMANYLLNPRVALHHTSCNQLLEIERQPLPIALTDCKSCDITGLKYRCRDKGHTACKVEVLNPKFEGSCDTKKGGGYMRPQKTFFVTNALVVKPNYDLSKDLNAAGLVEKKVLVGREEALKLLMASLVLEDPLTSVFLLADGKHYKKKKT